MLKEHALPYDRSRTRLSEILLRGQFDSTHPAIARCWIAAPPRGRLVVAAPSRSVIALALVAMLAVVGPARAQLGPAPGLPASSLGTPSGPAQLDATGRASSLMILPKGATTARSLAARASDVVDVRDYGAKCDDLTDDGPAFNAAAAAARLRVAGGGPVVVTMRWTGCNALIRTTINLTGIASTAFVIDGSGGLLTGETAGKPVIDAMHSEGLSWDKVSIFGAPPSTGAEPSIGIQIGRITPTDPVDGQHFLDLSVYGYFGFAAFYNLGSEVSNWTHPYLSNFTPVTAGLNPLTCFALVEDGDNHWNNSSQYVAQTIPQDTYISHDDNLFLNPQITTVGGCTPVFEGGSSGHKYVGGYIANSAGNVTTGTAAGYIVELWNPANTVGFAISNLDFDNMHMEQEPTDIFYITGGNTAPTMNGLRWDEHFDQAANSIFKLDPAITAIKINDLRMRVAGFLVPGSKVFDDPTKWTTSGIVELQSATPWNAAAGTFNGAALLGGSTSINAANGNFTSLGASGLTVSGTTTTSGSINAPCAFVGFDGTNGGMGIGCGAAGTPYLDFGGASNTRIIGDGPGQVSLSGPAGGIATFQSRTAASGGNLMAVQGTFSASGGFGVNGAVPTGKQDISGSCGGSAVCQKMAAMLIANGLASGTVTP